MNLDSQTRIVVAGAGTVGCYAGGCLARAGRDVTLLMRDRLAEPVRRHGLDLQDFGADRQHLAPGSIRVETDPGAALSKADLVLVTVKSHATPEIAKLIARHAPESHVVSLQNGVGNLAVLLDALEGDRFAIGGMVPFNVVQSRHDAMPPLFQRTTSGAILVGDDLPGLAALLDVPGVPVRAHADMPGVLWSKLVLNMNNALNALSGKPLVEELSDRGWRRLLATQMDEALGAIGAAGIALARIEGVHPGLIPFALRLPTPLFRLVAKKMLAIAPDARSSMWEDFEQGRRTEIDYLQGAVIELAAKQGRAAPLCERVVDLVKEREKQPAGTGSPVTPDAILAGLA